MRSWPWLEFELFGGVMKKDLKAPVKFGNSMENILTSWHLLVFSLAWQSIRPNFVVMALPYSDPSPLDLLGPIYAIQIVPIKSYHSSLNSFSW